MSCTGFDSSAPPRPKTFQQRTLRTLIRWSKLNTALLHKGCTPTPRLHCTDRPHRRGISPCHSPHQSLLLRFLPPFPGASPANTQCRLGPRCCYSCLARRRCTSPSPAKSNCQWGIFYTPPHHPPLRSKRFQQNMRHTAQRRPRTHFPPDIPDTTSASPDFRTYTTYR